MHPRCASCIQGAHLASKVCILHPRSVSCIQGVDTASKVCMLNGPGQGFRPRLGIPGPPGDSGPAGPFGPLAEESYWGVEKTCGGIVVQFAKKGPLTNVSVKATAAEFWKAHLDHAAPSARLHARPPREPPTAHCMMSPTPRAERISKRLSAEHRRRTISPRVAQTSTVTHFTRAARCGRRRPPKPRGAGWGIGPSTDTPQRGASRPATRRRPSNPTIETARHGGAPQRGREETEA